MRFPGVNSTVDGIFRYKSEDRITATISTSMFSCSESNRPASSSMIDPSPLVNPFRDPRSTDGPAYCARTEAAACVMDAAPAARRSQQPGPQAGTPAALGHDGTSFATHPSCSSPEASPVPRATLAASLTEINLHKHSWRCFRSAEGCGRSHGHVRRAEATNHSGEAGESGEHPGRGISSSFLPDP